MSKCPKCDKSFDTEQGVRLHNVRTHTPAGKTWGSSKGSFLYQVLANRNEIKVKDILEGMKKIGKSCSASYISHLLSKDSNIIKTRSGTYKLKKNKITNAINSDSSVVTLEKPKQEEIPVSRETLLLRVEHLENQISAIKKAHLALVNDVL